jgi:hypothetical protein
MGIFLFLKIAITPSAAMIKKIKENVISFLFRFRVFGDGMIQILGQFAG